MVEPFRQKDKDGNEVGSYRCYDPSQKKVINLETRDKAEALRKQKALWTAAGRGHYERVGDPLPGNSPVQPSVSLPLPVKTEPPAQQSKAVDIINAWAASQPAPESTTPPTVIADPIPSTPSTAPTAPATPTALVPTVSRRNKGGLSPEQSAKIGMGLRGMATRINVVLVGAGVSMFGKDPVPPDDEEIEMLKLGWEMLIEQYFVKNTAEPWLLVLVGNIMLAVSTYVRSPKRPKLSVVKPSAPPSEPASKIS